MRIVRFEPKKPIFLLSTSIVFRYVVLSGWETWRWLGRWNFESPWIQQQSWQAPNSCWVDRFATGPAPPKMCGKFNFEFRLVNSDNFMQIDKEVSCLEMFGSRMVAWLDGLYLANHSPAFVYFFFAFSPFQRFFVLDMEAHSKVFGKIHVST